jgi:hypothetical protein
MEQFVSTRDCWSFRSDREPNTTFRLSLTLGSTTSEALLIPKYSWRRALLSNSRYVSMKKVGLKLPGREFVLSLGNGFKGLTPVSFVKSVPHPQSSPTIACQSWPLGTDIFKGVEHPRDTYEDSKLKVEFVPSLRPTTGSPTRDEKLSDCKFSATSIQPSSSAPVLLNASIRDYPNIPPCILRFSLDLVRADES